MTQYKLIKTPEQFIIVSDEKVEIGDTSFLIFEDENLFLKHYEHVQEGYLCKKVIAKQSQIDFNGFEDIISYVDVEKLHDSLYPKASSLGKRIWIEGFNKANELSSNKEFTLEDMEYCYNTAKRRAVMQEAGLEADLGFKNYIDTYHQQPKEWMIEIAMEKSFTGIVSGGLKPVGEIGSKGLFHHTQLNPKLINGKIQITKIL
jgi:hypothetical protein